MNKAVRLSIFHLFVMPVYNLIPVYYLIILTDWKYADRHLVLRRKKCSCQFSLSHVAWDEGRISETPKSDSEPSSNKMILKKKGTSYHLLFWNWTEWQDFKDHFIYIMYIKKKKEQSSFSTRVVANSALETILLSNLNSLVTFVTCIYPWFTMQRLTHTET